MEIFASRGSTWKNIAKTAKYIHEKKSIGDMSQTDTWHINESIAPLHSPSLHFCFLLFFFSWFFFGSHFSWFCDPLSCTKKKKEIFASKGSIWKHISRNIHHQTISLIVDHWTVTVKQMRQHDTSINLKVFFAKKNQALWRHGLLLWVPVLTIFLRCLVGWWWKYTI